jgi:GAF domain-containing protein
MIRSSQGEAPVSGEVAPRLMRVAEQRLAVKRRLILGNATIGILLLLAGAVSVFQIRRIVAANDALQRAHERQLIVMGVHQTSSQMIAVVERILQTEDREMVETNMSPALEAVRASADRLAGLEMEGIADQEARQLLDDVDYNLEAFITASDMLLHQARAGEWSIVRLHVGDLMNEQQQLAAQTNLLMSLAESMSETARGEVALAHRAAIVIPASAVLGSLLLGAILLWQTTRAVVQPVEQLSEGMAQLDAINRLSTMLSLAPTLKEVFEGMRREVFGMVRAVGMSIMLLTPEGDRLNWIYGYEYGQEVDLSSIPPLPISTGFSGHVARTREVLLINEDVNQMHQQYHSQTIGGSPDAWLGLPLIVANELIGVLAIENDEPFPHYAVELLKTASGPLAIAIHNLIQFEEMQAALEAQSQQRIQLQAAASVAAAATSTLDLDQLLQQSVDLIRERFALYYVGLFLVDEESGRAMLRAGTGTAANLQMEQQHQLSVGGRSLIGGATGDGRARITQDVTLDAEWLPNPNLPETRAELALPLRVREEVIGALTVQSTVPHAFSPELIATLQTMSDQLAVAIENTRLLVEAKARANYQQTLNQVSAQLYRSTDVNEIVSITLRALAERLDGSPVELLLGRSAAVRGRSHLDGLSSTDGE